jgi:hypothetical protein
VGIRVTHHGFGPFVTACAVAATSVIGLTGPTPADAAVAIGTGFSAVTGEVRLADGHTTRVQVMLNAAPGARADQLAAAQLAKWNGRVVVGTRGGSHARQNPSPHFPIDPQSTNNHVRWSHLDNVRQPRKTVFYTNGNEQFDAEAMVQRSLARWSNVPTADFAYAYGGETSGCPSIIGCNAGFPGTFNGRMEFGWAPLAQGVIGVAMVGVEADMAPLGSPPKTSCSTRSGMAPGSATCKPSSTACTSTTRCRTPIPTARANSATATAKA